MNVLFIIAILIDEEHESCVYVKKKKLNFTMN